MGISFFPWAEGRGLNSDFDILDDGVRFLAFSVDLCRCTTRFRQKSRFSERSAVCFVREFSIYLDLSKSAFLLKLATDCLCFTSN